MRVLCSPRNERGIALPVAIFALVVIGALVAGVFFTGRIEVRSGENAMSGARATEAAQAGLQMGIPNVLTIGATLTDGQTAAGAKTQLGTTGSYYQDSVTRLNRYMYLLRSYGTYEVGGVVAGRRTMAMLVKRYMPELQVNAGATVVGTPQVKGSAVIDGNDHTPPGWTNCDAPGTAQPGIRTNSGTSDIQKESNVVTAATPEVSTSDTSVTNMSAILDTLFFQLAGQANITLTPAHGTVLNADPVPATTGTCTRSNTLNWGDPGRYSPAHACEPYFPIVYLNVGKNGSSLGDVRLHMVGQGVLLVNGNIELNAGSVFSGLVLVRGTFGKANGSATITGGVISQNAELESLGSEASGNLTLNYSRCAVKTALNNLAVTAPATYRGFIQF
ncbi:MAG: hypothetical protein ABJB33_03490 [Gemmatimonadota bacterium]